MILVYHGSLIYKHGHAEQRLIYIFSFLPACNRTPAFWYPRMNDLVPDMSENCDNALTIWMELRPALDGFYGIPQETRLLFSALAGLREFRLGGLLQMSKRPLRGGVYGKKDLPSQQTAQKSSQVVISLKGRSAVDWKDDARDIVGNLLSSWLLRWRAWFGPGMIRLGRFDASRFADYLWQELFGRTLPVSERSRVVASRSYRVCATPWRLMHLVGIERAKIFGRSRYAQINTKDADILIAQTPFPARVNAATKLVVHYHDAIPILMPHTISDRAFHQASHYHALSANVRDGAYFVCVSEATRQALLSLFPEAEPRAVTIHNMLPTHYYPVEPAPERIPGLVRRYTHTEFTGKSKLHSGKADGQKTWKLHRRFRNEEEHAAFLEQNFGDRTRFLLMVSTIEPRKNHARLLSAWEALHSQDPHLKLVLVGHIGWDYAQSLDAMLPWIEEGSLFLLQNVPSEHLRLLFRQAVVTVCPSTGEGFDFSGIEAMRCGGVVAASDIDVHREVYGDATLYFDPYDADSMAHILRQMIYGDSAMALRDKLRVNGIEHSLQYLPENILPKWTEFLQKIGGNSPGELQYSQNSEH